MSQSIATAVCNVSGAAYSRLHLNAVAKRVLPAHTRDALFQLFCDVRTNTPKDQVFFMRHAEALKPHTFTGWLAMLAALLYSTSGLALFSVGALGLMASVAFMSIFAAVIGGIMFACFVGVVATTLSLASIGLVAVASGAATTAAAGYLTVNFWKVVFQRLGFVRERAHLTSSSGQQARPTSSQHTYTTGDSGRSSQGSGSGSGYGQSHTPGYTPLSSSAPGENTRQPTHNKLTTEPAKDPFKKDITNEDGESMFAKSGSSGSSVATNGTPTSEGGDSAFGSTISQESNVRDYLDGALTDKSSKKPQGSQNKSTLDPGASPFSTGGGTGGGGSTVTTGAPAVGQKSATNDQDVNDIFGKGGSHAAPNTVQTGGGHGQHSGQGSGQSSAGSGGQAGGQRASKPSSGSASSGSTGTNFGQATNDSDINELFGTGKSDTAQSSRKPSAGAQDSGSRSSASQDSGSRPSDPQDSSFRSSGHAAATRPEANRPTKDSDINSVFSKLAPSNAQNASTGSHGPQNSAFGGDFGGFGRQAQQDIGLQSNFRGPTGQQGPQGGSGPRGASRNY